MVSEDRIEREANGDTPTWTFIWVSVRNCTIKRILLMCQSICAPCWILHFVSHTHLKIDLRHNVFLSIYFTSPPCLAKQFVPEIQFYLFMSENVPSCEFFLCVNQFVHPVEFLILCDPHWFSPFFPSSFFKIENWINLCTPLNSLFLWFTLIVPHFSLLHFLKIENRINLRTLLNSFFGDSLTLTPLDVS